MTQKQDQIMKSLGLFSEAEIAQIEDHLEEGDPRKLRDDLKRLLTTYRRLEEVAEIGDFTDDQLSTLAEVHQNWDIRQRRIETRTLPPDTMESFFLQAHDDVKRLLDYIG